MKKNKVLINWQYCNNLNDVNEAILNQNPNLEGLKSANDIISITYDYNREKYLVVWRMSPESSYPNNPNNPRNCSNCANAEGYTGLEGHYCRARRCGIRAEVYDCPDFEGE